MLLEIINKINPSDFLIAVFILAIVVVVCIYRGWCWWVVHKYPPKRRRGLAG
jgi:hypothetical protein